MSEYHTSVLLDESVSALVGSADGVYADATFGGGGHTAEILSRLSQNGSVLAFDRDLDAIGNRIDDPRLTLIRSDFRWIHNHVLHQGYKDGIDGILADLGVSSRFPPPHNRLLCLPPFCPHPGSSSCPGARPI